ncbi:MAG: DUF1573 domain-containing protein [Isosphaeraceae bacterium]|nr:DUF1573 domain-containing protein [Isosphaeraceae bacterium]
MRRFAFILAASALLSAHTAAAQQWVDSIFPERQYDFGTVARGSKVHHSFKLINRTRYDIHIMSWQAKCGCTEVKIGAQDIPPGTQTTIDAVIDTTRFQGFKPSGLTLHIDRPEYARVDLNLSCFIRGDILVNPGQADFQVTPRSSERSVTMTLNYYGGQTGWGVTKMVTQSPHVVAKIEQQSRTEGQVSYLLTATLKPTVPTGFFKDEITLHTNDPSSPTIPVSVTAVVQSAVTVAPSILMLGHVKPGAEIKKTVVVRSSQNFKLTALKADKPDLTAASDNETAQPTHKVTLTFKAPSQPGPFNAVMEIGTDLKDEPPTKLTAFATVTP